MRRYLLVSLVAAGFLMVGGLARAGEHTVTLQQGQAVYGETYTGTADSTIYSYSGAANTNYGRYAQLESNNTHRFLMKFKVFKSEGGPVPDGATVSSATLSIYKTSAYNYGPYSLYRVLKHWDELQVTWNSALTGDAWNTAGCDGAGTDRTADPVATPSCGWDPAWMAVDVTSSLQAWAGGAANEGWVLVDPYSNLRAWAARDYTADVSLRPKLTITYAGNTAPVAKAYALPSKGIAPFTTTFDASASTDVDGTIVSYAWTFGDGSDPASGERVEHVYASAETYTATLTITDDCGAVDSKQFSITGYAANQAYSAVLQDGLNGYAGTRDASPYKYHADNVYGFEPTLTSGEGDNYRPMVRFAAFSDEGGTIPRGAEIISATLCLYKTTAYNANWKVYQLKKGFVEGETSWNRASTAEAWDVPGASGDGTDRVAGVVSNPWMGWNPGWLMVDVTGSLQSLSGGANNCGWLLVDQVTGNIRAFASRENADQTLHPKLLITYRVPPTAVIVTTPNPPKGVAPCTISFDASGSQDSDGTILFYYWNFGDGENGEGLNVQHLYSSPGCYKATLTVTDDQGATARASVYVGVAEEGVGTETKVLQDGLDGYAGTEDTYLDGYAPNTARGTSEALNLTGNNHPLVKFKVFTTEGGPVPAGRKVKDAKLALYKYSAYDSVVGAKRVLKGWNEAEATWNKANASTNWGTAGASQVGVDVATGEEPLVTMPWDPAWIEFPVTSDVESFRTAALANNGWQVWYYWGNSNTRQFRSSEYAADSTKRPKLTVQYSGNSAPVAFAESDIKSGSPPLGVQFTGTGIDADGTIAGYSWDFGDGSPVSTEQSPVHQYLGSGRYTATLTVTDDGGLTGQATVSIEVEQPYTLTFQKGDGGSYSETEDCNLKSDYPTGQNEAGSIYLEAARSDTVTRRCLIRFVDIVGHNQGQIPHDAKIVSAKLRLSLTGAAQSQRIAVHRVTEGWSIPYGAPWWATRRAGGAAWGAAGCGYVDEQHKSRVQSPEDTQTLDGRPFPYEWDVTEAVKAWSADSDLNYGVVVEMTENAPMMGFRSSEHPEQALRPLLLVTISDLPDITKPKLSITSELTSQTKKAFVEGTKDPEVDTISLTADGAAVDVTVTNPTHWFAFVERGSNDLVQLVATSTDAAGNQAQVTKTLAFEALDARSNGGLTLQAGDSALITVTSALPGAVSMQVVPGNGGATLSGDLGEVKEVPYPTAGEFTALAKVLDSGGAVLETYEVSITAVSVTRKPGFALGVKQGYMGSGPEPYYEVEVTPASAASQVYLLAEKEDLLTGKNRQVTDTSVKSMVVLERVSNPYLQARFGSLSGRVVGRDYISGFKMEVDDFVGDAETGEGVGTVTMTPWIGGLTVEITLGMGSKFIPEESATKTFNTSTDFNPATGQVQISVRVPETAADFDVTTRTFQTLLSVQQEVETSFTNRNNGGVSVGRALLFMCEDNDEEPTIEVPDATEQPTEAWESHGKNADYPLAPRLLSFIERGMKGTWHVEADFDKLFGHSVDRSWGAPTVADPLYDSKANFKSYKPVYPGDDLGEEFRWPLGGLEEPLNNEVNDRGPKMPYKPGIQFGEQNMEATVTVPQNDGRTLVNKVKLPKRITVARLEVDGAVPTDPNQPVSNSNVTASTRDLFPKAIPGLPDREVQYVEIPDPQDPNLTTSNAKPIAVLKVAEGQKVWSASGTLEVFFDATDSYDPDEAEEIVTYIWDFGDGTVVDGSANESHSYSRVGVYYPMLTVISENGLVSEPCVFERIVVHQKKVDEEFVPPAYVTKPLGTPVQVTLYTAPSATVDVKLKVKCAPEDPLSMAFVSLSGRRKECNTPEYFRMTADGGGYASQIVYLQGSSYSSLENSVQLVVEGKEKIQSAGAGGHFEYQTSQQDADQEPFLIADTEKTKVKADKGFIQVWEKIPVVLKDKNPESRRYEFMFFVAAKDLTNQDGTWSVEKKVGADWQKVTEEAAFVNSKAENKKVYTKNPAGGAGQLTEGTVFTGTFEAYAPGTYRACFEYKKDPPPVAQPATGTGVGGQVVAYQGRITSVDTDMGMLAREQAVEPKRYGILPFKVFSSSAVQDPDTTLTDKWKLMPMPEEGTPELRFSKQGGTHSVEFKPFVSLAAAGGTEARTRLVVTPVANVREGDAPLVRDQTKGLFYMDGVGKRCGTTEINKNVIEFKYALQEAGVGAWTALDPDNTTDLGGHIEDFYFIVPDLDIASPRGDPEKPAGEQGANDTNEQIFDDAKPADEGAGQCTFKIEITELAKLSGDNIRALVYNELWPEIMNVGSVVADLTRAQNTPRIITVLYDRMPGRYDDFGKRIIHLKVEERFWSWYQPVEFFFYSTGTAASRNGGANVTNGDPNWYVYWAQLATAFGFGPQCSMKYDSAENGPIGEFGAFTYTVGPQSITLDNQLITMYNANRTNAYTFVSNLHHENGHRQSRQLPNAQGGWGPNLVYDPAKDRDAPNPDAIHDDFEAANPNDEFDPARDDHNALIAWDHAAYNAATGKGLCTRNTDAVAPRALAITDADWSERGGKYKK